MEKLKYPDRRPSIRGECYSMPRPCPFISCTYHGFWMRVDPREWVKMQSLTDDEIVEKILEVKDFSCVLDLCDRSATLDEIGKMMKLTRERIRQLEGMSKKKGKGRTYGVQRLRKARGDVREGVLGLKEIYD